MGEYLEIKTGVSELISVANRLRSAGESLRDRVVGVNGDIAEQEHGAETFPSDKFTDEFMKTYHGRIEDSTGTSVQVNHAIMNSAVDAGQKLIELGEFVGKAMANYGAADDESATDIAGTPLP